MSQVGGIISAKGRVRWPNTQMPNLLEQLCIHHFKAHSLRHTRASEYTEQGMPIGVIQQILGHCSLQMTLHYAKVSENKLYEKWKETEELGLLNIKAKKPGGIQKADKQVVNYERVKANLDAVKVPFGTCFKPSKLGCKQQINHCLECGSFCSCVDDMPEYEAEIARIKEKIRLGIEIGRSDWVMKNQEYLEVLEKMVSRIRDEKVVHKNGETRKDRRIKNLEEENRRLKLELDTLRGRLYDKTT